MIKVDNGPKLNRNLEVKEEDGEGEEGKSVV
jgi:hypothetical protein